MVWNPLEIIVPIPRRFQVSIEPRVRWITTHGGTYARNVLHLERAPSCSSLVRQSVSSKVAHTCQKFPETRLSSLTGVGSTGLGIRSFRRCDGFLLKTGRRSLGRVGVAMIVFGWQPLRDGAVGAKPLVTCQNKERVALGPLAKATVLAVARFSA
jgi:hypothetical protein